VKPQTESQIQKAVIKWWAMAHKGLGVPHECSLMAFPLQGVRNPVAGARLKAEGMRKGTSDLFLAVPIWVPEGDGYSTAGLWIEMKKPGGRVTPEQGDFLARRKLAGYDTRVCYSFNEAVIAIKAYLGK